MAQAHYVTNAIRALITDAGPKPSTIRVQAAYAQLIANLAGHSRLSIPQNPYAVDLRGPRRSLEKVHNAVWAYLTAILHEAANLAARITPLSKCCA